MKTRIRGVLPYVLLAGLALALAGCLPPTPSQNGGHSTAADPIELNLDGTVSAVPTDGSASALTRAAGDQTFTGTLYATPTGGGTTSEFFWSVTVHPDFTMESNSTVILFPGDYDFDLVVSDSSADQQYVGSAAGFSIIDGENTVPLVLRPVIGDTLVDAIVAERIADFRILFGEIPLTDIASPVLRLRVDDGAWVDYDLNPANGQSVDYVMNLPQGLHQIDLQLFDGPLQRGRTRNDQGPVDVQPGEDVSIDLISLHGETVLALSEEGDEATFTFNVPAEAVDEAGGLGDLEVMVEVSQAGAVHTEILSMSLTSSGATGSVTFSPLQFGDVTIVMNLTDTGESPEFYLGGCATSAVLSTSGSTVDCPLTLHRRAIFGGSLLSTLGVNVYTTTGEPVAGADVVVDGHFYGVTGDGSFGTPGYKKVVRVAGSGLLVHAELGDLFGEETVTLAPLGIHNVNVFLDSTVDHDGDGFPPSTDCDDEMASVYPGAPGTGQDIDNDCNGVVEGDELSTVGDVALFVNSSFVDYGSGAYYQEGETTEDALLALGYAVSTFTGITAGDIGAATSGKSALVIPEMEYGSLAGALDAAAQDAVRNYVSGGGKLVIFAGYSAAPFLNGVFGYATGNYIDIYTSTLVSPIGSFSGGPPTIPWNDGTWFLTGLPAGSTTVYLEPNGGGAAVAVIPWGAGEIVFLAYDWFNGVPLGTQDGGWLDVLNRALQY